MPTARELLQQADALMRRNRAPVEDADIPLLTDIVAEPGFERSADALEGLNAPDIAEAVPTIAPAQPSEPTVAEGEPSVWLDEAVFGEPSVTGVAPDSVLAVAPAVPEFPAEMPAPQPVAEASPAAIVEETFAGVVEALAIEPPAAAPGGTIESAPDTVVPPRDTAAEMARWEALAEEIRMQVLQRIDIFADAGLKDQLNERLQPVVDRASAELVQTISLHVGQLLRAYVAEAIEREIDKWRQGEG